jgi:hypothetical protein
VSVTIAELDAAFVAYAHAWRQRIALMDGVTPFHAEGVVTIGPVVEAITDAMIASLPDRQWQDTYEDALYDARLAMFGDDPDCTTIDVLDAPYATEAFFIALTGFDTGFVTLARDLDAVACAIIEALD